MGDVTQYQSCILHAQQTCTFNGGGGGGGATDEPNRTAYCTSLSGRLIRWDYTRGEPKEVIRETKNLLPHSPNTRHEEERGGLDEHPPSGAASLSSSFVICFPGDRLPDSLRGVEGATLTDEESAEVASLLRHGSSSSPVPHYKHVLDLQEPEAIAAVLAGMFPVTRPPARRSTVDSIDEVSTASSSLVVCRHYLVVFPEHITGQGFSSYAQLFADGALTNSGEPQKGTYTADPVTKEKEGREGGVHKSAAAIGRLLTYCLASAAVRHQSSSSSAVAIDSIDLVGFSKGCTALNQLVADLGDQGCSNKREKGDCEATNEARKGGLVASEWGLGVHYVDGGLNSAGAFISERRALDQFREAFIGQERSLAAVFPPHAPSFAACGGVTYSIYSTPRQRMDPHRPFLDYERRMMAMHLCGVASAAAAGGGKGTHPSAVVPAGLGGSLFSSSAVGAAVRSVPAVPRYFTLRPISHPSTSDGNQIDTSNSGAGKGHDRPPLCPTSTAPAVVGHGIVSAASHSPHKITHHPASVHEGERDWAIDTLPKEANNEEGVEATNTTHSIRPQMTVRVLEDVPPPKTSTGSAHTHLHQPVMEGLKQHMLAMVRFGRKNGRW